QVLASRSARRVAHRALEVAGRRHLDQADAGVLLVLGAEAAVERAPLIGLRAIVRRNFSRQAVLHLVVEADVGADEVLADPVGRAALAEIDALPLRDDL